jgi:hypothetical protein
MQEARSDWLFADPFFTTEAQEMSRAFDPANTDAPTPAVPPPSPSSDALPDELPPAREPPQPNPRAVQHIVCPFCGHISEIGTATCKHCGLENSHITRTATRNKIGPWYVWQARNPSAPGMNWATLIALIKKGRVTPRSIMRGPTTGQLWRFAARVKGVSREFGVCWHCAASIQSSARVCPACKRLQQPPINADALLETDNVQSVQSRPLVDPRGAGLLSLSAGVAQEAGDTAVAPAGPTPPARLSDKVVSDMLSGAVPIIDMGADAIPAAAEMRAFELPDVRQNPPHESHLGRKMLAAAIVALACGAAAAWYSPDFRQYCQHSYATLMAHVANANGHPLQPADLLDDKTVADTHMDSAIKADAPETPTALMSAPVGNTNDVKAPAVSTLPPPQVSYGPGSETAEASTKPASKVPTASAVPAAASLPSDNSVVVTPPPTDPQSAETRAWELHGQALEAEKHGDFATAVKDYQWIQNMRLPDGVGPSDVDTRLALAQKAVGGNANNKN